MQSRDDDHRHHAPELPRRGQVTAETGLHVMAYDVISSQLPCNRGEKPLSASVRGPGTDGISALRATRRGLAYNG
ncbi:hypothetical protein [Streptomyces cacaoi]|uniref:hypothetical protein n=1 Tax=Streptomyces cacaoi TaxID=1898 RepID=UPI0037494DB6